MLRRLVLTWYLGRNLLLNSWPNMDKALWDAARYAVKEVSSNARLQLAAAIEAKVSYCPSCGQVPDGDRRFDLAREITLSKIAPKVPKRSELDAAIALQYWMANHD